jgi:hypothetical protein
MDRYSHLSLVNLSGALNRLSIPEVETDGDVEAMRATGTDGSHAGLYAVNPDFSGQTESVADKCDEEVGEEVDDRNSPKEGELTTADAVRREEILVRPAGLEPATRGLRIRCSAN